MNKRIGFKNKSDYIYFTFIFLLACIIFIGFLSIHYTPDTYNIINIGYKEYAFKWSLNDGRLFMFLISMIMYYTNASINFYIVSTLIVAIFISSISVIELKNIIIKYSKTDSKTYEIIALFIAFSVIFNFMYIECMYFLECAVMALSILLIIKASDILVERKNNSFIKSLFLLILALFCYQGTLGFYFAFVIVLSIIKNEKNIKIVILDFIKCIMIAMITLLANILFIKIVGLFLGIEQLRTGKFSNILKNFLYIINNLKYSIVYSEGLFFKNLFLVFLFGLIIISSFYILINRNEKKKKILFIIIISIISMISSYLTYLLSLTSFLAGRLKFSLGALIGLIFMYLYTSTSIFKNKIFEYIVLNILIIYCILLCCNTVYQVSISKQTNNLEKEIVLNLDKEMKEYEIKNNIEIKKIGVIIVKGHLTRVFEHTRNKSILTYNALKTSWSVAGAINLYSNRTLTRLDASEENLLDENEEYKIIGDTLYIKVYMY